MAERKSQKTNKTKASVKKSELAGKTRSTRTCSRKADDTKDCE